MEMTLSGTANAPATIASNNFWTRFKRAFREANEIRVLAASAARYYAF